MANNIHVDVHHITRVEGHGNIKVDIQMVRLKNVNLKLSKHRDSLKQCSTIGILTKRL